MRRITGSCAKDSALFCSSIRFVAIRLSLAFSRSASASAIMALALSAYFFLSSAPGATLLANLRSMRARILRSSATLRTIKSCTRSCIDSSVALRSSTVASNSRSAPPYSPSFLKFSSYKRVCNCLICSVIFLYSGSYCLNAYFLSCFLSSSILGVVPVAISLRVFSKASAIFLRPCHNCAPLKR